MNQWSTVLAVEMPSTIFTWHMAACGQAFGPSGMNGSAGALQGSSAIATSSPFGIMSVAASEGVMDASSPPATAAAVNGASTSPRIEEHPCDGAPWHHGGNLSQNP